MADEPAPSARDKFAGGDQAYLRGEQYATTANLDARARLHQRHGTAAVPWPEWLVAQFDWSGGAVLDVGCGTGMLWDEGRPPVDGPITLADQSEGMARAAAEAAARAGYEVASVVADAQHVPVVGRSQAVVVANHMLYHVPDPARAVAEFVRVLVDDGILMAATNGPDHMNETKRIEFEVFGTMAGRGTVDAFGFDSGRPYLEREFGSVELRRYEHPLVVTDPDDVVAYLTSYPPGEDASPAQRQRLRAAVTDSFEAAGGAMRITRSSGVFLCGAPRR